MLPEGVDIGQIVAKVISSTKGAIDIHVLRTFVASSRGSSFIRIS